MPYMTKEEKIEVFYTVVCERDRWQSVYRIAKKMGYTHSKVLVETVQWLADFGFVEVRMKERANGQPRREVRPAMVPCDDLNMDSPFWDDKLD